MEHSEIKAALEAQQNELRGFLAKANEELPATGKNHTETKAAIEKLSAEARELNTRLAEMESKAAVLQGKVAEAQDDYAAQFAKSDAYKNLMSSGRSSARMEFKTAILNQFPVNNDQPLVVTDRRPGVIANPDRPLRIRDLVPTFGTTSNLIEYVKENVFTNNAGPQISSGSPTTGVENVAKPESAITFTLSSTPVITLAHNIPASRQVLDDSPMLEGYIRQRLIYGLNLEEETEILTGTGSGGELNGLFNQATTNVNSASGTDTAIDVIRRLMTALQVNEFAAEAVVLNPLDWQTIELTKDNDGRYIFAQPQGLAAPRIWGVPVVVTNSMTSGRVLVGAFSQAAALFDRMSLVVEMFREHSDYAAKNMVLLQAEKRVALAVHRPLALQKAGFASSVFP